MQWHVQDENGGVFGPVDFKTLKEWVEDGRVSPLSQLSNDEKKSWNPAVSVADLEMNCVAEIEPGSFYGPIHQKAMVGLVNDGSIPSGAILYRRGDASKSVGIPAAAETILAMELQQALDETAALEFDKKGLEERLGALVADFEVLQGQIASLCSDRDELLVSKRQLSENSEKLEGVVVDLRKKLEQITVDRDAQAERVEYLQSDKVASEKAVAEADKKLAASERKVAALEKKISELEESAVHLKADYQGQIDSLNERNLDLKSRERRLTDEAGGLHSEIDALRKNLHDQQRVMDEREHLHAAEFKDKEFSWNLRIDNMTLEHEAAVNSIRQETLAGSRSLKEEIISLQDEVKNLQKQNKLVVSEKEAISKRIRELDCKCERSHDESSVELEVKDIRIEELTSKKEGLAAEIKNLKKTKDHRIDELAAEIEGLLTEITELRKTNEQLKADFVAFEERKAGEETDRTAERKLIVLKQLFIEAAGLLQDVEDDVACESEEGIAAESSGSVSNSELLDFEEVEPYESPVPLSSSAKKKTTPFARPVEKAVKVAKTASAPEPEKQVKSKKGRKWSFGSGKKNLNHGSLAELEAQARIELQRLSSKGGDISALFDKNK